MPRMSTRRWMVAVALVGLLMGAGIGGARLKERREYFLFCAQYHANQETWWGTYRQRLITFWERRGGLERPSLKAIVDNLPRVIAYHAAWRSQVRACRPLSLAFG